MIIIKWHVCIYIGQRMSRQSALNRYLSRYYGMYRVIRIPKSYFGSSESALGVVVLATSTAFISCMPTRSHMTDIWTIRRWNRDRMFLHLSLPSPDLHLKHHHQMNGPHSRIHSHHAPSLPQRPKARSAHLGWNLVGRRWMVVRYCRMNRWRLKIYRAAQSYSKLGSDPEFERLLPGRHAQLPHTLTGKLCCPYLQIPRVLLEYSVNRRPFFFLAFYLKRGWSIIFCEAHGVTVGVHQNYLL